MRHIRDKTKTIYSLGRKSICEATRAKSRVPKVAWAGGGAAAVASLRSPKCELELSAPSRKYSGLGQGYEAWRTRSSRPPDWLPRSAKGGSSAGSRISSQGDERTSVIIMINRHPPVHIFAAIFGGLEKVKATCPVFLVSERANERFTPQERIRMAIAQEMLPKTLHAGRKFDWSPNR